MLNLNADLLYNNCLSHHFSEFQWTPALSGKLILGFQKHRKPECSILKICLVEHAPKSPYVARAFGTRKAPCAAKKYRVRCFQNYVRYFKNLSKTLQYDFFWLVVRSIILSVTPRRAHEACDMASQASAETKPSTRLSFFVWKRIFFPSDFAYRPLVFGENDHRITHLFKNALQSVDFWKRWPLVYVWTDENAGFRIRGRNASFTASMTHALQGMLSYFHCLASSYGRAKTIRIRYVWTRIFFENGGKNLLLRSS